MLASFGIKLRPADFPARIQARAGAPEVAKVHIALRCSQCAERLQVIIAAGRSSTKQTANETGYPSVAGRRKGANSE